MEVSANDTVVRHGDQLRRHFDARAVQLRRPDQRLQLPELCQQRTGLGRHVLPSLIPEPQPVCAPGRRISVHRRRRLGHRRCRRRLHRPGDHRGRATPRPDGGDGPHQHDITSATSQFFINYVDNTFLDPTAADNGYAVFVAKVIQGWDVVQTIEALQSLDLTADPAFAGPQAGNMGEVPLGSSYNSSVGVHQADLVSLISAEVIKPASVPGFFSQKVDFPEGFRSGTSVENAFNPVQPQRLQRRLPVILSTYSEAGPARHRDLQRLDHSQHLPFDRPLRLFPCRG